MGAMARPVSGPTAALPRYRSNSLEWAPLAGAVPSARRWTRVMLAEWGLADLSGASEHVVSELITNAVEAHQRERLAAPVRLTLIAGLGTVLVIVRDASTARPAAVTPAGEDEHGRGLLIVEALSARWDVRYRRDGGKAVRALIRGQRRA